MARSLYDGDANADTYSIFPHCNANCSNPAPHCGDGIRQEESEACDDGNRDNGDYCQSDCQAVLDFVVMGLSKVMRSATTATPKTVIIVPPIVVRR